MPIVQLPLLQKRWVRSRPVVSVVIPCFNYGNYIREALDSIHGQTLADHEVIVVDDGSDDPHTANVLRELAAEGVRVYSQENLGLPSARKSGVERSQGKYVCCLDADDMLDPTYLEKAVALLESRPDIGFAYPWVERIGLGEGFWENPEFSLSELIVGNLLNHPAVFRRAAWEAAGGYWDALREGYEDWEFWINLSVHGFPGARIPEPLFLYRKHGHSMIDNAVAKHDELFGKIRDRHESVYQDPDEVSRIERSYKDRCVVRPFLNISREDQYLQPSITLDSTLVVSDGLSRQVANELMAESRVDGHSYHKYMLATTESSGCPRISSWKDGVYAYYLPDFLKERYWRSFTDNFLLSRKINHIWLARCDLTRSLRRSLLKQSDKFRLTLCVIEGRDLEWVNEWEPDQYQEILSVSDQYTHSLRRYLPENIRIRTLPS